MRDSKGQFVRGSSGNPKGRPKRADEQFLVDLWNDCGKEAFSRAVLNGERWAVSKLVDKLFANRKLEIDHSATTPASTVNLHISPESMERYNLAK